MSLYEKKPIVVIDDSIYDLMGLYKEILCKKEFGTPAGSVKFIKRSELNNVIPAERIDDFGVYFYVFEEINTADEYISACSAFANSPNIEIVLLFCQNSSSFDLCYCSQSELPCKVHNIGIRYDFTLEKRGILTQEELKAKNCVNLMTLLLYLLSFEEGSFDDFTVKLKLNYPSLYAAVLYSLIDLKDKRQKNFDKMEEERDKIKALENEKSHRYRVRFSAIDSQASALPVPDFEKDAEKSLAQISTYYAIREEEFQKRVNEDISATRYAMAEMDEYAQGAPIPDIVKNRAEQTDKITTGDDLLRRVDPDSEEPMNLKQAIGLARELVKTQKPAFRPFLVAGGFFVLVCLLIIASYYGIQILKNPGTTFDMKFLAVNIGVPVLIILAAMLFAFIANLSAFGKTKTVLKDIYKVISERTANMGKFSEKVRAYLNDFITVFCNYHVKDFYILQCKKRLKVLEQEKESIIHKAEPLSEVAELIDALHRYEKELEEAEHDERITDEFYRSENSYVGYDENEEPEAPEVILSESEKETELKKHSDARACVAFIKENCSTQVDGTENDAFISSQSPWISAVTVSDCVNGGVL